MSERGDERERLPSGTVTFLFADIEGSTRLLNALGDRYREVRLRSRELVRTAASRHGGHEVDWAGDGVFLAFGTARSAVKTAADLQRMLADEPWEPDAAIRLRMGIHTGEPSLDGEGYVGIDVVLAARICAAAHGGQVVMSQATKQLLEPEPLPGAAVRPLGEHRLKDVLEPQRLFQLVVPGLADTFPPLTTLGGATLPTLHHRLVGRTRHVEEIQRLLAGPDVRLVTITGPGGAGKSRLALEVAAAVAVTRPVRLVGLASLSDPALVPPAIAGALGIRESTDRPLIGSIAEALSGTQTVLYLDNLEHLAPAAGHVRALLDAVPGLDILVTSRVPLRLSGEYVLALEPLPVDEAVELFGELAASRGARLHEDLLPEIAQICRRLDCLPLAIELVTARLTFLSPTQLLEALDEGLALELEGPLDLPARQRTLRATLDWSYGLLTEDQRQLHGALAMFAGGCTLEDARAVAGAPAGFLADLETLVLGSLVRGEAAGSHVRLSMLETVREDAISRLASAGRLELLRERHAERFLELALASEKRLAGAEQAGWTERLTHELDNIRTALDWLLTSGRGSDALRATTALERFWRAHAHVTEARRRLALGLSLASDLPPGVRGAALRSAAHMAMGQSDWDEAGPLLREAIMLFRDAGMRYDEVVSLCYLSFVAMRQNALHEADSLALEALEVARVLGDPRTEAYALMALADVDWSRGEHERALEKYEKVVALSRSTGDPLLVVDAVYHLGMAAFQGNRVDVARRAFEEALELARDLRDAPHTAAAQFMLSELDAAAGDTASARARASESLGLYAELEDARSCARCLVVLAVAAGAEGAFEEAARLLGAARASRGDEAPDEFERPLLERLVPELERELGAHRREALEAQGARGEKAVVAEVVRAGTRE
jgi:predicted ATPase/class 3 adenylate cyclase